MPCFPSSRVLAITEEKVNMADSQMPKVDMAKEFSALNDADKHFVRKLESLNTERARQLQKVKTRNKFTVAGLAVGVLGIYFYSMYAVRQERFLEGFDEVPEQKKT